MARHRLESVFTVVTLTGLLVAVAGPFVAEAVRQDAWSRPVRTLSLTAVMSQGVWTDEPVTAAGAWRGGFRPARPVLRRGETVRLRLQSADVVHTFSVPDLGIDPVEVHPGETAALMLTPERAGTFRYYCTTVCGERHFAMQGWLEVRDAPDTTEQPPVGLPASDEYWTTPLPPASAAPRVRGAALFRQQGCVTCHGEGGRGGVRNPNSMNATVPELRTLARRTFLFAPGDVTAFERVLESGEPLEGTQAAPDVPLFGAVKQQYLATRRLVADGRRSAKLDPNGPRPPLDMPAWGVRLNDADIHAILTYLLDLGGAAASGARPDPLPLDTEGESR